MRSTAVCPCFVEFSRFLPRSQDRGQACVIRQCVAAVCDTPSPENGGSEGYGACVCRVMKLDRRRTIMEAEFKVSYRRLAPCSNPSAGVLENALQ